MVSGKFLLFYQCLMIQIMLFCSQGDSSFYWKQHVIMEASWVGVIKTQRQIISLPLGICVSQDTLLCLCDL